MRKQDTISDLVELGHIALEFSDPNEFRSEMLPRLEAIFHSPASVFLDWEHGARDSRNWQEEDMYFPHFDERLRRLYYRRLRYEDPLFNWLASGKFIHNRSVTRLSNLVRQPELNRSALYRDLLQPMKYQFILTLALNCGHDLIGNISLLRPLKYGDFGVKDMRAAQLAVPMLTGAYRKLQLKQSLAEQSDLVNIVAHLQRDQAALIVSDTLQPVFFTDRLRSLLDRYFKGDIDHMQELLYHSAGTNLYLKRFRQSGGNDRRLPASYSEQLTLSGDVQVQVDMSPIIPHSGMPFYLQLLFAVKKGKAAPGESAVRLSMREIQIAQMLAKGCSARQAGEKLCISPWTVKNHLKSIYAKLEVNNRATLARALDKIQG